MIRYSEHICIKNSIKSQNYHTQLLHKMTVMMRTNLVEL